MPSGKHKSRSMRRVFVRTPGGKNVLHYKKRKPNNAKCSCGAVLKGTARERPYKMKTMAKSKKRPLRPYGGNLCSKCMREKIIKNVRVGNK